MSRFELATISFDDMNIWCNDCVKLHLLSMIERARFVLNSYCILIGYFYRMVRTSVLFPHVGIFVARLRVRCTSRRRRSVMVVVYHRCSPNETQDDDVPSW